jgi:signal transduction histidine kinase
MLMPASAELIALCRSQVALLAQGLGASLAVVYLTEKLTDTLDTELIPIVAYPEAAITWDVNQMLALLSRGRQVLGPSSRLLASGTTTPELPAAASTSFIPTAATTPSSSDSSDTVGDSTTAASAAVDEDVQPQRQMILPLMYEGMVMGLLVTARSDRPWNQLEQTQIERIARTIAIACVLDQRGQWLEHDLRQLRRLQAEQHDIFDTLLHQFRNPLTALRTFGKLLLRRLLPEDRNRELATGIVRESDRLQELLQQFDVAIDLDIADLPPADPAELTSAVDWEIQLSSILRADPESQEHPDSLPPRPMLPGTNYLTGTQLQLQPHTVAEILDPLLDSAAAIAQDRELDLHIAIPPDLPPVQTDVRALREVLNNLIDNALKYTPTGGQIYVQVRQQSSQDQGNQQAIVIADTGPGIPSQDLEHLFERHYRGVQADTDIPGTGLGLAIAHDLILQMRGKIQVFSPAEQSGFVDAISNQIGADEHMGTAIVVWLPEENSAVMSYT